MTDTGSEADGIPNCLGAAMVACFIDQRHQERCFDPPWKRFAVRLLTLGMTCLRADAGETNQGGAAAAKTLTLEVQRSRDRQVMDGFGGSLAFWGFDADEEALWYAFEDLGAAIVLVPGEVSTSGLADDYHAVLKRVARVAPKAKVLSCWQPRSSA